MRDQKRGGVRSRPDGVKRGRAHGHKAARRPARDGAKPAVAQPPQRDNKEARSTREQADKTRSGANGPEAPEGVEDGLCSRRGLYAVAEGAKRDKKRRGDPMWASVMTDLLARWALGIYLFLEGDREMMAMLFAVRIVEERTQFDQVPRLLKQDVADILVKDFGMPELVPGEFGGTADSAQ